MDTSNMKWKNIHPSEMEQPSMLDDMVNSPPHYAEGSIETIDYIVDVLGDFEAISYCHGNVIKYTGSRLWKKGNPVEDAKKAVWYLNKMIELMEKTKGKNW